MVHRVQVMQANGFVPEWYSNSMRHVITECIGDWLDDRNERMYEEMFGVKLGFRYARIDHVVFPNREAAVEFMLRWS